jgi:prefoldin beta subunit
MEEEHNHEHEHDHEGHDHGNPLGNLSPEIQQKIQELQMMEQSFQQLLRQKNAFSMEANETDYVIGEVEKATGEISRVIAGQVVVKSSKEEVLEDMNNKKKLIETRMKSIDEEEKKFSENIESIREEVMKAIQG